ncbi:Corticotropin-releasing factor-binding protein [Chelonia mydas]|uniref:Corticotropin-releasing factor-binding protein n=1 Tax=Chelonia mydas TaxID=8469 RepID=M7B0S0_CHEMY|nr:Corticotropin-releasing factor-binding protein [Chelonia mydas]
MASAFRLQCHCILIFLAALKGETRYLEARAAGEDEPFLLLSADLKRELSGRQLYHRALRCIDMLSVEGQFTFTAEQPQLHCAAFFIGDPEELITIDYDFVNIDCQGGDFLKDPLFEKIGYSEECRLAYFGSVMTRPAGQILFMITPAVNQNNSAEVSRGPRGQNLALYMERLYGEIQQNNWRSNEKDRAQYCRTSILRSSIDFSGDSERTEDLTG